MKRQSPAWALKLMVVSPRRRLQILASNATAVDIEAAADAEALRQRVLTRPDTRNQRRRLDPDTRTRRQLSRRIGTPGGRSNETL